MAEQPKTRPSLLLRLQGDDNEAAWSEFQAIYEPTLRQILRRFGLAGADAEDVRQQILAAVHRDLESWRADDKDASFRRWLFTVARNQALKYLAKERRRFAAAGGTEAQMELGRVVDERESVADALDRELRLQQILFVAERIRGEFQELTWRAFWMTHIEGQEVADVATILKTTTGNVYVARSRVIARLRERLTALKGEPDADSSFAS